MLYAMGDILIPGGIMEHIERAGFIPATASPSIRRRGCKRASTKSCLPPPVGWARLWMCGDDQRSICSI